MNEVAQIKSEFADRNKRGDYPKVIKLGPNGMQLLTVYEDAELPLPNDCWGNGSDKGGVEWLARQLVLWGFIPKITKGELRWLQKLEGEPNLQVYPEPPV